MYISKEGADITRRFFEALNMLKANGTIRGLQTFTNELGINRWNFITVREEPDARILKPEWIYELCIRYNISTDWIILGRGGMFNK